ncbi:MAG TPA: hypothetical protein VGY53_09835 [Isosphaeraceae bacterium]|nr:hypothetical protein [Isosphaeraceae bacterium]
MSGSLVANLGLGPQAWLFLSFLACVTLFFKFTRFWSARNLDLLLLFALAPGMMTLVGKGPSQPWIAFVWLFTGSALWLGRSLADLGMSRRPLLEPNLNAAGLGCLVVSLLGLLVTETVNLPVHEGVARNPAEPATGAKNGTEAPPLPSAPSELIGPVQKVLDNTKLPPALRRKPPEVILSRVLACLAHLALVAGLIVVGWKHFDRLIAGLAVATAYLLLPYTRIALVDSGQLVPAALIVAALALYTRPALAGGLIGLACGWMPAALGLVPLWAGFYRGRGTRRFLLVAVAVVVACGSLAWEFPLLARWAVALGAPNLYQAGLWPGTEAPPNGSFWSGIDPGYRLPVLILYLVLVVVTTFWPAQKNLGELIALSAALLVASQFWYVVEGGTLVILYLPLVLLMMFRPTLVTKRPVVRATQAARAAPSLHPVR